MAAEGAAGHEGSQRGAGRQRREESDIEETVSGGVQGGAGRIYHWRDIGEP
jgi:hypothetical protein